MSLNIKNRTILEGDNLDILRGINSDSVDLIYLDPPFNSNRTYSAPIGSQAAGASFKDALFWGTQNINGDAVRVPLGEEHVKKWESYIKVTKPQKPARGVFTGFCESTLFTFSS